MGNTVSLDKYRVTQHFDQQIWQLEAQKDYCKIYRNLETGQLCQEYIVELPSERIKQNIEVYQDRYLMNNNNIVKVYYSNYDRPSALCSTKDLLKVRTETIPYRINQLPSMSIPQALLVLQQCFLGFGQISQLYTHVRIQPNMIGINSDGKIKVWLNSNFSICCPEDHSFFAQNTSQQTLNNAMIRQISEIVEIQTLGRRLPQKLKVNILRASRFQQAIDIVHQFRTSEKLNMTSINLPGRMPLTTTFQPQHNMKALKPSILNGSHVQQLLPQTTIHSKSTNLPTHYISDKSQLNSRNQISRQYIQNKSKAILRQSDPNSMPLDFPAEFIQSQLVRNVVPSKSIPKPLKNQQYQKQIVPNNRTSLPNLKGITKLNEIRNSKISSQNDKIKAPYYRSYQNNQDQKPSPLISVSPGKSLLAGKLQIIPENIDYSFASHQTPYFIQPSITPRFTHKGVVQSYSGISNETNNRGTPSITITPPPAESSSNIESRVKFRQTTNSFGDQVNSSYTPIIINKPSSEVVESTPVPVFSNIEYGHGVIRNRKAN